MKAYLVVIGALFFLSISTTSFAGGGLMVGNQPEFDQIVDIYEDDFYLAKSDSYKYGSNKEGRLLESGYGLNDLQTMIYTNKIGKVFLNETYCRQVIVKKKYFNDDGTVREAIYYIYSPKIQLVRTVHIFQDGTEAVLDESGRLIQ